jgi:alkylation response protein AidB-like acyl-CoA dehydrogenase
MTELHSATALAPDFEAPLRALLAELEATAVARDRLGGHAATEREAIRRSGLLRLSTPLAYGGHGLLWATVYQVVRRIAAADSALAHVFAFHHLQVATVLLYGKPAQHAQWLPTAVTQNQFWGNALNPNDKRTLAQNDGDGFVVHGPKSYCSGSVGADYLTFSAWHEASQSLLIAAVPSNRNGVSVQADWDAFGQKQTDSGTVHFDQVQVAPEEVLVWPGTTPTPRATLRPQVAQLVLVNLYLGIAAGALAQGLRYTREKSRPWFASGVAAAVQDPYVQHRYGELQVILRPAQVLADLAAQQLDSALAQGDSVSAETRGQLALAVAEAKALAHRAALEISSQIFELTGAGATGNSLGLDRFWRNARVHTLHDPIDYKLRDIGRHLLEGVYPTPTSYS